MKAIYNIKTKDMTTKSIIGRKYVADGTKAIDLNLRQEVELGTTHKYTIIADPYVCEYYRSPFSESGSLQMPPRKVQMTAVNVLDNRTGLTYAVEYNPANLICDDCIHERPAGSQDFIADAADFAERVKAQSKAGKVVDGCSLVLFAAKRENGKVSGVASVIGSDADIFANLVSAISHNKQVRDHIGRAFIGAQLEKIFNTK